MNQPKQRSSKNSQGSEWFQNGAKSSHKQTKLITRIFIVISAFLVLLNQSSVFAITEEEIRRFSQNDIQFYEPCVTNGASGKNSSVTTALGGYATISGSTAAEKVWTGLRSLGISEELTAGIMGNMEYESHFNPAVYEWLFRSDWSKGLASASYDYENNPIESRGIGLAGFSFSFRTTLWKYVKDRNAKLAEKFFGHPEIYGSIGDGDKFIEKAKSEGASDTDINTLYSYEITYLINEALANKIEGAKSNDYAKILDSKTVDEAAVNFADYYENCDGCSIKGGAVQTERTKGAQNWYNKFHGNTSFGTATAAQASVSDGSNVTLIGDSIAEGAKDYGVIDEKLPKADVHAQVSKHFYLEGEGVAGGPSGMSILKELAGNNSLRPILVFALGTNDADPLDRNGNKIEDMIGSANGASLIVLVTAYEKNVDHSHNNQLYKDAATAHDNVVVADWASLAEQHKDDYFDGSENTHPNKAGTEALYDLILQTINGSGATMADQASSANSEECCDENATGLQSGDVYSGARYNCFSDTQWRKLAAAAHQEQGSIEGVKAEASIMANLFEDGNHGKGQGGDCEGLFHYVRYGGWFGQGTRNAFDNGDNYSDEEVINAVKDVLANGNRTIPKEILEHDCFSYDCGKGNLRYYSNDQGSTWIEITSANRDSLVSEFKRGVTYLKQDGGTVYVFWRWADQTNNSGDPFGYFPNYPPSGSTSQPTKGSSGTTTTGSNVTWSDDGWINSGMNGYSKMELSTTGDPDMFGSQYTTKSPNGHDPGPNKITLHAFEGVGGNENTIKSIYATGFPPHFTIDLKNHKVYQHTSIWNASAAIKGSTDGDQAAGVQIEILGYDNLEQAGENTDWYLGSEEAFSDDDFAYLAELLNAISVETGIPLTSSVEWNGVKDNIRLTPEKFVEYQGILAHKHTPARDDVDDGSENDGDHDDLVDDVIWTRIQKALQGKTESQQTIECTPAGGVDEAALQNLVKEWVWKKTESNWKQPIRKPAYDEVIKRRVSEGKFVGDMCTGKQGAGGGVDCGGFVTTLMQESGWDPDYNTDPPTSPFGTTNQLNYLKNHTEKWKEVTGEINSNEDAHVGDVLIISGGDKGGEHHTLVYVGKIPGYDFSPMASASQCDYAPSEDWSQDIMHYKNKGYHIFRNLTPPTSGGGTIGEGGLTEADAKKFMMNYGENKNGSSESAVGNSLWCMCGSPCSGGSNCVTFSAFFLNKFTKTPYAGGSGFAVAGALNTTVDDKPSVWSVFSYGSGCSGTSAQGCVNHTGVILGKQGNTWIVGHASCTRGNNGIAGKGDGTMNGGGSGYVITSDDINAAIGNSTGKSVRYAHPQGVDTSAISNYLTNGT